MTNNKKIGFEKESLAVEFLVKNNYIILCRNYRCYIGEIDIIAQKNEYIVFIEVKYRSIKSWGFPQEAINYKKQQKIIKTAQYYIMNKNIINTNFRFDVVVILGDNISIIENAFES